MIWCPEFAEESAVFSKKFHVLRSELKHNGSFLSTVRRKRRQFKTQRLTPRFEIARLLILDKSLKLISHRGLSKTFIVLFYICMNLRLKNAVIFCFSSCPLCPSMRRLVNKVRRGEHIFSVISFNRPASIRTLYWSCLCSGAC